MKTIEIKLFKFEELNEEAKRKAIEQERENVHTDFIYDEAHETVKKFNNLFGTSEGRNSWLESHIDAFEHNVLELKGLRLRKYILNNFGSGLFKGRYKGKLVDTFADGTKIPKSDKHPIGKRHVKRYSKALKDDTCCVLTGVCYDNSLLQPMYEFLEWKLRPDYNKDLDLEDLIKDCFKSLEDSIESEIEYLHSDEGIIESIEAKEHDFTEEGLIY